MVTEGRGRLFRRKDGKYLIYLAKSLAIDSMFPFRGFQRSKRGADTVYLKVSFKIGGKQELLLEPWKEPKLKE